MSESVVMSPWRLAVKLMAAPIPSSSVLPSKWRTNLSFFPPRDKKHYYKYISEG